MLEKEAKKWVKENTRFEHSAIFGDLAVEPSAEKGFIAGAEFGYKKGFEFGVKSNEKVNQIVANEWHDLRKNPNDLPKDSIRVLVLTEEKNMADAIYIQNEGFKDPDFSNWYTAIAWIEKEKVLPKEWN